MRGYKPSLYNSLFDTNLQPHFNKTSVRTDLNKKGYTSHHTTVKQMSQKTDRDLVTSCRETILL